MKWRKPHESETENESRDRGEAAGVMEKENLIFTDVIERLPETKGSQVKVYIKKSNGRISKGMFYINGRKPTFASYGSEVLDVVAWAYWR